MSSITGAANPTAMTNSQSPNAADAATADFSGKLDSMKHAVYKEPKDTSETPRHDPAFVDYNTYNEAALTKPHHDETNFTHDVLNTLANDANYLSMRLSINEASAAVGSLSGGVAGKAQPKTDQSLQTTVDQINQDLSDMRAESTGQGTQPVKDAPAATAASVANQANQDMKNIAVEAEKKIAVIESKSGQSGGAAAAEAVANQANQDIKDVAVAAEKKIAVIESKSGQGGGTAAAASVANHASQNIKDVAVAAENTIAATASKSGQGEGASGIAGALQQFTDGIVRLKGPTDNGATAVGSAAQALTTLENVFGHANSGAAATAQSIATQALQAIKDVAVSPKNTIGVTAK
ncbi:hypothetical protein [Methylobacterium sp. J-076]|uniref:hypothetical protein n=1 Tax=Methylobacterium sp. J-076 TaxID=2836655 RepID=UPI001FBAE121|nr:hypothetical protein [Methylobacterium sp. J-076]MCJ2011282.1 hypothetical protein [Methylobacterium sp. J-076]